MKLTDISLAVYPGMTLYRGNPPVRIRPFLTLKKNGANVSEVCLGSHTGTHVDAPVHFFDGRAGVDRLPLERFIGPVFGAVLTLVRSGIDVPALEGARIPRGATRVVFRTRNSRLWHPARPFRTDFVYLEPEAAGWLVDRGVQLVGTDYLSIEGFGIKGAPTHRRLLGAGVPILEGLDLFQVGAGRYQLAAFPVRWRGADGAPVRAVLWK